MLSVKRVLSIAIPSAMLLLSACSTPTGGTSSASTGASLSGGSSADVSQVMSGLPGTENNTSIVSEGRHFSSADELRAVWISYFELSDMIKGRTQSDFQKKIDGCFDSVSNAGMNAVIVHVRPSSDSFYKSEIFPWSLYVTGVQGVSPGYDPLDYMITAAHSRGLELHAWINPYRICQKKNLGILSDTNPAKIWLTDENPDNDDNIAATAGSYYYNPASEESRSLIISGVTEILENYAVDGIHFDDYFYPTTSADFDRSSYKLYVNESGASALSLDNWRREQVNQLIRGVYEEVKRIDSRVMFGVSPAAEIAKVRNEMYADCPLWMSEAGYIDYICPQLYFGFDYPDNDFGFSSLLDDWTALPARDGLKFYIGLASYKIGAKDAGSTEWIDNTDTLMRETELCRSKKGYNGVAFFSYTSLFGSSKLQTAQRDNLLTLFSDENN